MKTEKLLRNAIIASILLLVVATPFIITSSMYFPFITGKNFFFRVMTEFVFFLWIPLALANKKWRPDLNAVSIAILSFIGVMFVSAIMSANPLKAFWSNYERMEGFITLVHLAGLYFVVASLVKKEGLKILYWCMNAVVASSLIMTIYSVFQLLGKITINQGGVRVDGTLGNAAYLAAYMLISFFFALFLFLKSDDAVKKTLYAFSGACSVAIMYFTATRGAFVGLAIGLFVTLALLSAGEKNNRRLRIFSAVALASLVIGVAGIFALRNSESVSGNPTLSRLTSISTRSGDAEARFAIWNMALKGFKDKPVFGWGQENFIYVFNKYYDPALYHREQWFDRTHNIFLDWLVMGGLLGLLSYLAVCLLSVLAVWQRKARETMSFAMKASLTGLLIGYFAQNFFVFDNIVTSILFYVILGGLSGNWALGAISPEAVSEKDKKLKKAGQASESYSAKSFLPTTAILFVAVAYFSNAYAWSASSLLIKAMAPAEDGKWYPDKSVQYFEQAIKKASFGRQEVLEQLTQTATRVATASPGQVSAEVRDKFISLTISELEKFNLQVEGDARMRVFLGSFLLTIGDNEKAVAELEKALALSPGKQVIMFSLADAYMRIGRSEEALKLMTRAYEITPGDKKDIAIGVAVAAISAGDEAKAKEILVKDFGTPIPPDIKLARAYFGVKEYQKTLDVLQEMDKANPGDFETTVSISAVYMELGRFRTAIDYVKKAIEIRPEFKEQGEYYIKELEAGRKP